MDFDGILDDDALSFGACQLDGAATAFPAADDPLSSAFLDSLVPDGVEDWHGPPSHLADSPHNGAQTFSNRLGNCMP